MATDPESVLAFVTTHYAGLKAEADKDNIPPQAEVTDVIALIEKLFGIIKKGEATHEEIVEQLKELKKQYGDLKSKLNDKEYTRYKEADENLNTIMAGIEEEVV